jgi:GxxExxY protein
MPFHCPLPIRSLSREEFEERDRVAMQCAYASQNELGRLCDEPVYENDMAARLRAAGLGEIHTQLPLMVSHRDFAKTYRLDLIIDGALYELKTVNELAGEHEAQLLNYMMLLEIPRAKLLNFRSAQVKGRLHATPLDHAKRRAATVDTSRWLEHSEECRNLKEVNAGTAG